MVKEKRREKAACCSFPCGLNFDISLWSCNRLPICSYIWQIKRKWCPDVLIHYMRFAQMCGSIQGTGSHSDIWVESKEETYMSKFNYSTLLHNCIPILFLLIVYHDQHQNMIAKILYCNGFNWLFLKQTGNAPCHG